MSGDKNNKKKSEIIDVCDFTILSELLIVPNSFLRKKCVANLSLTTGKKHMRESNLESDMVE